MKTYAESGLRQELAAFIAAVDSFEFERLADITIRVLWAVVIDRPDFEEMPEWIADREAAIRNACGDHDYPEMAQQIVGIVEKSARLYGSREEMEKVAQHSKSMIKAADDCDFEIFGEAFELSLFSLLNISGGVKRLPVIIEDNHIRIGRHTKISFNRTLRIPEDGTKYPLPAGLGELPIHRVADYAKKVPPTWLEDGGFFIPLYQREALFLGFEGAEWRPTILKVAVGGINAITGEANDEIIRHHKQDYVVIPDQKWLDGINSGEETVSQFVAMPLGQGYTIEEQLTDEAKFGGFQLVVFEAKDGLFPDQDPSETAERNEREKKRLIRLAQKRVIAKMTELQRAFAKRLLLGVSYEHIARSMGLDQETGKQLFVEVKTILKKELGEIGFTKREPNNYQLNCSEIPSYDMGIARGGSIKQQIKEDTYDVDCWDKDKKALVVVHIVNSKLFESITGGKPPESPITADEYRDYGIPWFDAYDELAQGVLPAKNFQNVKGVFAIDRVKRIEIGDAATPMEISPEFIRRITPPTRDEYVSKLTTRLNATWQAGQWRVAHRQASCLLDIEKRNVFALQIRADCNNRLERYQDAACDASECLESLPESVFALTRRAHALLKLGESEMALVDADAALEAQPNTRTGLRVRAEARFALKDYDEAIADASRLLELSPKECLALRIRAECQRQTGMPMAAIQDATLALAQGDVAISTLLTRAAAYMDCGDPKAALMDTEEALRREPWNRVAGELMNEIRQLKSL